MDRDFRRVASTNPLARGPEMHPIRAFLIAFTAGSVALFGGYGAIAAMTPAPVGNTITV